MSDQKITRDELLILLRDTYCDLNARLNILRDTVLHNMDDIVEALARQKINEHDDTKN